MVGAMLWVSCGLGRGIWIFLLDICTVSASLVSFGFGLLLPAECNSSWCTERNFCIVTGPSFLREFSFSIAHIRCILVFACLRAISEMSNLGESGDKKTPWRVWKTLLWRITLGKREHSSQRDPLENLKNSPFGDNLDASSTPFKIPIEKTW